LHYQSHSPLAVAKKTHRANRLRAGDPLVIEQRPKSLHFRASLDGVADITQFSRKQQTLRRLGNPQAKTGCVRVQASN
jgi:hypothetical protein